MLMCGDLAQSWKSSSIDEPAEVSENKPDDR
jgi:hypothetical protein